MFIKIFAKLNHVKVKKGIYNWNDCIYQDKDIVCENAINLEVVMFS